MAFCSRWVHLGTIRMHKRPVAPSIRPFHVSTAASTGLFYRLSARRTRKMTKLDLLFVSLCLLIYGPHLSVGSHGRLNMDFFAADSLSCFGREWSSRGHIQRVRRARNHGELRLSCRMRRRAVTASCPRRRKTRCMVDAPLCPVRQNCLVPPRTADSLPRATLQKRILRYGCCTTNAVVTLVSHDSVLLMTRKTSRIPQSTN